MFFYKKKNYKSQHINYHLLRLKSLESGMAAKPRHWDKKKLKKDEKKREKIEFLLKE
jgi:hypothetical protein